MLNLAAPSVGERAIEARRYLNCVDRGALAGDDGFTANAFVAPNARPLAMSIRRLIM